MEMTVLFGVEHLKQRRGGITLEVLTYLVYLIEHNDRIACTALSQRGDDASGHRANVGAAVTAYLGLVMQSTQRDAGILTMQGVGNRLAQ